MAFKVRSLQLGLPFGLGSADIDVTRPQADAAWNLYVEYATRVATQDLAPGAGSARAALDSLYSLFDTTRQVLREAGPDVARGRNAIGPIAIRVLNEGLRPFLTDWHVELAEVEDESAWDRRAEFDEALKRVRQELDEYVGTLAEIAGVIE